MAAIDMTGQLRDWVAQAISDGCMGEDFGFDTTWNVAPGSLLYTVIVTLRNPFLGRGPLLIPFSVPVTKLSEATIRPAVHTLMAQLRQARSELLAAGSNATPQSPN
jgi:hypothetical protein